MSTHMSTPYLDILIRLNLENAGIVNLHLLAIPVFDRHTGQLTFEALDVLWRDVLIGVSTDGEKKMTGRVSGETTRFQQVGDRDSFEFGVERIN